MLLDGVPHCLPTGIRLHQINLKIRAQAGHSSHGREKFIRCYTPSSKIDIRPGAKSPFARRSSKYLVRATRVAIFLPGLNFRHSSGFISKAVDISYSPKKFEMCVIVGDTLD